MEIFEGWKRVCVVPLLCTVVLSDLHKKTCQQGFLDVEAVAARTKGGR